MINIIQGADSEMLPGFVEHGRLTVDSKEKGMMIHAIYLVALSFII